MNYNEIKFTDITPADITNPFAIPHLIQPKVELEEILSRLRRIINKEYMPTATGEAVVNSKPSYVRHVNIHHKNFPKLDLNYYSGIYAFDEHWFNTVKFEEVPSNDIFYHLAFSTVIVIVNLKTEETIVQSRWSPISFIWHKKPQRPVAIDRIELDNFLS